MWDYKKTYTKNVRTWHDRIDAKFRDFARTTFGNPRNYIGFIWTFSAVDPSSSQKEESADNGRYRRLLKSGHVQTGH